MDTLRELHSGMTDSLQHALHSAATQSTALSSLAVFCATTLLFLLVAVLAAVGVLNLRRISWALVARVAVSLVVAAAVTLLLKHFIQDPRPFTVEHYTPLAHATNDNGFPSDHTLIAALLAFWVLWMDRRLFPLFVIGLLLVMFGRLAIGAHHTLDVLASVVFAVIGYAVASTLRFPESWHRTVLPPSTMAGAGTR